MVLDCNLNYTDYLTNEIANPFYATLTVSSFDPCLAACTSDIQCLGVGYDSSLTTAQCLLSENNFPVTVSCKTCRFSGKSCDNSGSIVVNPTTMPQTTSNDVTTKNSNTSPNDATTQYSITSPNGVTTTDSNTIPIDVTQYIKTSLNDVTTKNSDTSQNIGTTNNTNASLADSTTLNSNTSQNDATTQNSSTSSNNVTYQDSNTSLNDETTKTSFTSTSDLTPNVSNTLQNDDTTPTGIASPKYVKTDLIYMSTNDVTNKISNMSPNDLATENNSLSANNVTTQNTDTSPNNISITSLNDSPTQFSNLLPSDVTIQYSNTSPNAITTQASTPSQIETTTQIIETSSSEFTTQNSLTSVTDVTIQNGHSSTGVLTTHDTFSHESMTLNIDSSRKTVGVYNYNLTTIQQSSTATIAVSKTVTDSVVPMSSVSYNVHSTTKYVVGNTSTLCICYCYEDANKSTLVEWTSDMRRNLLIPKDTLSLQTRKLFSASDPRFSSYIIGMTGLSILVCFGVLFLLFDVSKLFAYIFKRYES